MAKITQLLGMCVFAVATLSVTARSQSLSKEATAKLFEDVAADEKLVADCDKKVREAQLKEFGKVLPKIAGHCWEGCPTFIPKPYYPPEARRMRVSGNVVVDTVVDEKGKVCKTCQCQ